MVDVYSAQNITLSTGMNFTGKSRGVSLRRFNGTEVITSGSAQQGFSTDFAQAVYGDGPYSLTCPNRTTEFLGQNIDALA